MAENSGKTWYPSEEVKLRQLWADTQNVEACAASLGRSNLSIECRLKRLGLQEGSSLEHAKANAVAANREKGMIQIRDHFKQQFPDGAFHFDETNFWGKISGPGYMESAKKYKAAIKEAEAQVLKRTSVTDAEKYYATEVTKRFEHKLDMSKALKREGTMKKLSEKRTYVLGQDIGAASVDELLDLLNRLSKVETDTIWVDGVSEKFSEAMQAEVNTARKRVNKALEARI